MGVIEDVLWSQAEVRRGLLMAATLAVGVAVWIGVRGRPWVAPSGLTLACGVVLAVALTSMDTPHTGTGLSRWSQCRFEGPTSLLRVLQSQQGLANVTLFVPVGLFAAALHGRMRAGLVIGLSLSVCTEVIQGLTWGRDCSSGDLVANLVGAFLGAIIGRGAGALLRGRTTIGGPPPSAHQP